MDEKYLSDFENEPVDSEIHLQKPFDRDEGSRTWSIPFQVKRREEDNTYLSYNKVIGTTLDEKLYLAFQILDYALLVCTGRTAEESTSGCRDRQGYHRVLMTMEFISRSSL